MDAFLGRCLLAMALLAAEATNGADHAGSPPSNRPQDGVVPRVFARGTRHCK